MRTKKTVSTISYNSIPFCKLICDELLSEGKISDYIFVYHIAEEDETKNHIHLLLQPNTLIDTMQIQKRFLEPDEKNPLKPLGCIDFRPSNYDDWILYSSHFEPYLKSKGEDRVYSYDVSDFYFPDPDTFIFNWNHAFKGSDWMKKFKVVQDLQNGFDPFELIMNGRIPFNLSSQGLAFEKLKQKHTFRNGRLSHEESQVNS